MIEYYFRTTITGKSFEETIPLVKAKLQEEGFGVLTEIDIKQTLKNKLNADFKKYSILEACNPNFAHKALQAEDKIGVFLPCNVIVEENRNNEIEVSAVDPAVSMSAAENGSLAGIATEVREKLKRVIVNLSS